jgi:phosphatidylcholine synthase
MSHPPQPAAERPFRARWPGWLIHGYTALGVVIAFLAAMSIAAPVPRPRAVFLWLLVAVLVDATDGPLVRRFRVKERLPQVAGRVLDDIIDYMTFTFLPLLLVWRMEWLPAPAIAWIAPALVVSVLGFAHTGAKQEAEGFFRGFPSYWNVVAFYAGLWYHAWGPWPVAAMIATCTLLTVLPVRFVYPNLAPRPWRAPLLFGAVVWTLLLLALLWWYPRGPQWLMWLSLVYPALYTLVSFYLDARLRLAGRRGAP